MDEDPATETVSSSSQLEMVRTTELECATAALLSLEVDLRRSGEELVEEDLEAWSWNPNRLLIALAVSDMNAIFINESFFVAVVNVREREKFWRVRFEIWGNEGNQGLVKRKVGRGSDRTVEIR